MATATTPRWALRYPALIGDEVPDVPLWMSRLALDLDGVAMDDQGLLAARPTSTVGTPGKRGRYYFATDATGGLGALYRDNGTGWDEIPLGIGQAATTGDYKYGLQSGSHGLLPSGLFAWLLADGAELAAGYTTLIPMLTGNPFGIGPNGRPKLPDFRERVPVMPGAASGLTTRTLGTLGGAETHTLTTAEIPAHSHGYTGAHTVATVNAGSFVTLAEEFSGSTGNAGGGGSHNNLQPFLVGGSWFVKS